MIVDLHLDGRQVIIIGGGSEGLKRINSLLNQDCEIMLFSSSIDKQLDKHIKSKRVKFKRTKLKDAEFLSEYKPYIVMAATNDSELNNKIVQKARSMGALAYASDDPDSSDFAHPSIINLEDTIQVAISTGGKSPAMAKRLKIPIEEALNGIISSKDLAQIRLQKMARKRAKERINGQQQRKQFLYTVINDQTIKRLMENDDIEGAQAQVEKMLGGWNEK